MPTRIYVPPDTPPPGWPEDKPWPPGPVDGGEGAIDASEFCTNCLMEPNLGSPSFARWIGPDGYAYCSLHFINLFGHAETLVRIEDYVPPTQIKAPAP